MNLTIFDDSIYFEKLHSFLFLDKVGPTFPFEEMFIDPNNLITDTYDFTDIYNFLNSVHFCYYYEQQYIGYTLLEGKYYIICVDDEINISIIGNDEVNWTKLWLDDDEYIDFKDFCKSTYNISCIEPDYDHLLSIEEKNIDFY